MKSCQHYDSIRHPLNFPSSIQQQKSSIHPQTKVSLWELWNLTWYVNRPRRHLTHLYWTSVPAVVPAEAYELVLVPLSHSPGAAGEYWLRKLFTDKRAFVEIQVSRGEFLAHQYIEQNLYIYDLGYTGMEKRNSLTLPASSLPQGGTA